MDDVVNRLARELADAIAAAVAEDPRVEACRERARAAGFEMRVTLEAVVGFVNRTTPGALAKLPAPQKALPAPPTGGRSSSPPTIAASCGRCGLPRTRRRKKKSNNALTRSRTHRKGRFDCEGPFLMFRALLCCATARCGFFGGLWIAEVVVAAAASAASSSS